MVRRGASREPINAWLGEEIRLEKGRLVFQGSLRVDGTITDGRLTGPVLIVGQGGKITGQIQVQSLVVYGRVDARAHVVESVTIAPGGVFSGELVLERPVLTVEDGGRFQGRVRMASSGRRPVRKGTRSS